MKKIYIIVFVLNIVLFGNAQQNTVSVKQDSIAFVDYTGYYAFNKGDFIPSATITYSNDNGMLNYETTMGSGTLIKMGIDTFISGNGKSKAVFVRDSTKKVVGIIIDDVRGVYLEGKKTAPPSSQTRQSIEIILQKEIYQLTVR